MRRGPRPWSETARSEDTRNKNVFIYGEISPFLKSKLLRENGFASIRFCTKSLDFICYLSPKKSWSVLAFVFHFLGVLLSDSVSNVANAEIFASVVISKYFIVVSKFWCPNKKLTLIITVHDKTVVNKIEAKGNPNISY